MRNGYNVSYYLPFIDFEKNIWISETDSARQHPKCYSKFCNPKNLSFVTSQESDLLYDTQEPGPSSSEPEQQSSNPQFRMREVCMSFGFK